MFEGNKNFINISKMGEGKQNSLAMLRFQELIKIC